MEDSNQPRLIRFAQRRIEKRGLRPRVAASIIAILWLFAILAFGVAAFLVDRDSFETAWDGMWWATQTVTTVGYGDVVPEETSGKLIGGVLMIGGLSLFAVVTGLITSAFVAMAQAERRQDPATRLEHRLDAISDELIALRSALAERGERPPGPPKPPVTPS